MRSHTAAALSLASVRKRAKLMSSIIAREWEDQEARKRCWCAEAKASKRCGHVEGERTKFVSLAIRVAKKTRAQKPSFLGIFCYDNRRSESAEVFVAQLALVFAVLGTPGMKPPLLNYVTVTSVSLNDARLSSATSRASLSTARSHALCHPL